LAEGYCQYQLAIISQEDCSKLLPISIPVVAVSPLSSAGV